MIIYIKGSRIHWIEIHEESWCPAFLRQIIQTGLQIGWQFYGLNFIFGSTADSVASIVFKRLQELECNSILDLCSGGCGPSAYLNYRINQKIKEISNKQTYSNQSQISSKSVKITNNNQVVTVLTDLFPFETNWKQLVEEYEYITFCPTSVDATNVPLHNINQLFINKQKSCNIKINNNHIVNGSNTKSIRLRTLFGSFHHFHPPQAIRILTDAIKSGDGFIMAEAVLNRRNLFDFIKWPVIMALLIPIEWIHLIARYWSQPDRSLIGKIFDIIRMLSLTLLWYGIFTHDAIISCSRIYLEDELIELSKKAMEEAIKDAKMKDKEESIIDYEWKAVRKNSRMMPPLNVLAPFTLFTGIPKIQRNLEVKGKKKD